MPNKFIIYKNDFVKSNVDCYYHVDYTGYGNPENPDFLNTLKNTFNVESKSSLKFAKKQVKSILYQGLPIICKDEKLKKCQCVVVPRAKALKEYFPEQLQFSKAVKKAISKLLDDEVIEIEDGTSLIIRKINTKTTHFKNYKAHVTVKGRVEDNDGKKPYPGITKDTCFIDSKKISRRDIILIDDIYTKTVNIDEDCIQALYDIGANKVIFYAIGRTI